MSNMSRQPNWWWRATTPLFPLDDGGGALDDGDGLNA
jgi:hypothetical protein